MPAPPKTSPSQSLFSRVKDGVLFLGGLAGMVYEAGIADSPRPILVCAYMLIFGFPVFAGFDRLLQRPGGTSESSPPQDETSEPKA